MTPTLLIKVFQVVGHDLYGQTQLSQPVDERVAPVRLNFGMQSSTVRTDSGATLAHAEEDDIRCVLLAKPGTAAIKGSVIDVLGHRVRVQDAHPRYRVTGRLDHIQLECVPWA